MVPSLGFRLDSLSRRKDSLGYGPTGRPGQLSGSWPPAAVRDDQEGLLLRSERGRRARGIGVLEFDEDDMGVGVADVLSGVPLGW